MKDLLIMKKLEKTAYYLEIILTILLAVAIIIGLFDIIKYFLLIFNTDAEGSYDVFKHFLGHTLLLVVGIELMLMLLSHSTSAILELVLYVIARKMLIYGDTMLDLVLGTVAIAGVFAIQKYLEPKKDFVARDHRVYSASTSLEEIIEKTGATIPSSKGHTLGGLVCNLAEEACVPVSEGAVFESGGLNIKVVKVRDGVIEKVMITKDDADESLTEDETTTADERSDNASNTWHY